MVIIIIIKTNNGLGFLLSALMGSNGVKVPVEYSNVLTSMIH